MGMLEGGTMDDKQYLLEQYKSYVKDLGNIGLRDTQMDKHFVSVISALLVFVSLTGTGEALVKIASEARSAVSILGILVCLLWFGSIHFFGCLYNAKFTVIKKMEEGLQYECFKEESELLAGKRLTNIKKPGALILIIPFLVMLFA